MFSVGPTNNKQEARTYLSAEISRRDFVEFPEK